MEQCGGGGDSLANPEILIPLFFATASFVALWLEVKVRSTLSAVLVIFVLTADLAAYGHALEWRSYRFNVAERLADPPSVQFIKSREADWNSFRLVSYAPWPWDNYEALDYPNNSIARGLQSANGYDMLQLTRPAIVMGNMSPDGVVRDIGAFGISDQGLNLFNVKYLLAERNGALGEGNTVNYGGVRFHEKRLDLRLAPGIQSEAFPAGVTASEIVLVSTMSNSTHIPDGTIIAKVSIYSTTRKVTEQNLKIGRDTSEWAYDRSDVRSVARHARSKVVESWPVSDTNGDFEGHRYLARFAFEKTEVEKVRFEYLSQDAELLIARASLYDSATGSSYPLNSLQVPTERWHKLANFGRVDLYENQKAMKRAWFVSKVIAMPEEQVLKTIKSGLMPDGQPFDPAEVALLESESFGTNNNPLLFQTTEGEAEVSLIRYEPRRIEMKTRNASDRFLVLSEVFYPGWKALVDGTETEVFRTDDALRGVKVTAGEHKIEFVYEPASFKLGATISGLGVVFLSLIAVFWRRQSQQ